MLPDKTEKLYLRGIKAVVFAIPFLTLYISPSLVFPHITGKNFAFRILVEIAAVLWLGLAVLSRQYRLRNSVMLTLVLVFTFITGLADIWGVNPYNSLWSGYERMDGYLTILHLCLYFMIIKSVFKNRLDWIILLNIFALVSIMGDFYVLLEKFGYVGNLPVDGRPRGTLGNTAFVASYLVLAIVIKMILTFNFRQLWARMVYLSAIGLDLLIIYYTATRGAMLAIVVGIISFCLFYIFVKPKTSEDRLFRKIAISVFSGVLVLSVMLFAFRDTALIKKSSALSKISQISLSDPTTKVRLIIWGMAWEGVKERPILGWGQENFIVVYSKYFNPVLYGMEKWADRPHNTVFDWLVNAGFLGLISYLSLFVAVFYSFRSAWQRRLITKTEAVAVSCGLFAYFFQNLFLFDTINTYIIFFALLAYADSLKSRGTEIEIRQTEGTEPSKLFKLKIVSVCAVTCALTVFSFTAYMIHYKPIKEAQILQRIIRDSPHYTSFPEVLDYFKKALDYQTFGDTSARWMMLGIATETLYSRAFNEEGAEDFIVATAIEMEKQVAENPGDLKSLTLLITLFNHIAVFDRSFTERAEVYVREAVEVGPNYQWVYLALSDIYFLKGEYENAFETAKRAVELDAEKDEPQLKLAMAAIRDSREDAANKALEKLKEIRSAADNDIALGKKPVFKISELSVLVEMSKKAGNFRFALRFYNELIAISPENAGFHLEIADIYLLLGDKANAIKEAKKAAEINPSKYSETVEDFINSLSR